MAVNLSPVFQDAQFTSSGALLNGGFINSYVAGSSTPLATYTDNTGATPQANPITLNARGEVASPIWLTSGLSYKLRLFDSSNNFIREFDNVKGVNDTSLTIDQWIAPGLTPTYVSATQFTLAGDQTTAFHAGRRTKSTVTAGTAYSTISSAVFGALTTVTVVNDAGSALDSGLSAVQLGLLTATNVSFPSIIARSGINADITSLSLASNYGYSDIKNADFTVTMAANAVTLALKTQAGTDPSATDVVQVAFRNSALTSNAWVKRTVTAALSGVIASTATLGTANNLLSRIMLLLIDNAGTVELAWCNYAGSAILDEATLISTTTAGAGSTSANVIYSTTSRSNVAFRILGYFESTQATAGTWITAASVLQGNTGSALKSIQGILGAPTASTSGTSIDYTGIPSWVRRITLTFNGVSTNSTSPVMLQIGDAGGVETSGYLGSASVVSTGPSITSASFTTGFPVTATAAATSVVHGSIVLTLLDPANAIWSASSSTSGSDAAYTNIGNGSKSLSPGPLDRVRLTTVGGTATFDAGSVNIFYE